MEKRNKNKFFHRFTTKGFTMLETLVAISIFSASILALLSVLAQGVSNTNYAKTKITASYLAQEGIEYVNNMRDTFVLYDVTSSQNGWNNFTSRLLSSCQAANGCYFGDLVLSDYTDPSQPMAGLSLTSCAASCPLLLYDSSTGKYNYASGAASNYIRKINVNPISADELKISSTVYWTQGSGTYHITFSESLFNWME